MDERRRIVKDIAVLTVDNTYLPCPKPLGKHLPVYLR